MEFEQFVSSLKPITKILLVCILIESVIITLNLIEARNLVLFFPKDWIYVILQALEVFYFFIFLWKSIFKFSV